MDDSIAILGRQPLLGIAELESLYGADKVTPIGADSAARVRVAPCSIDFSRLGGTVKLCKLLAVLETTNWKEIERFLVKVSPGHAGQMREGKMHLGLSAYGLETSTEQMLATGLRIKKAIHANSGRTVRIVPNKQKWLNTAQVLHNKLISPNGWELIFVRDQNQTIVAQSVAVQDIEQYGKRDFGRPKRDARVGMLPPKLAQIIINLAIGSDEFEKIAPELSGDVCLQEEDYRKLKASRGGTTILDPFCGTGVVLQEALLMGYEAYGTDIEPRMIAYSRANLEWLTTASPNLLPALDFRLSEGDATSCTWQQPFTAVATEAYLGRPFTASPTAEVLAQTVSDCNLIIRKFLQNLRGQLEPGTRLCVAMPAWRIGKERFRSLPLIDHLSEIGYNLVSLRHVEAQDLLYYREGQIVARQLLLMTRI